MSKLLAGHSLQSSHAARDHSTAEMPQENPAEDVPIKQWRKQEHKDLSIDGCNLLRSSLLLTHPRAQGAGECHTGKPTLSTPRSHDTLGSPCEPLSIHIHTLDTQSLETEGPQGHPTLLEMAQKQVFEQVDSGLSLALHKLRAHVWGGDRIEKDLAVTCKSNPKSEKHLYKNRCLALRDSLFQAEPTSLKIHN